MTHEFNQRELVIDLSSGEFKIRPIETRIQGVQIIGPVDYGWAKYKEALKITRPGGIPEK